ncbi:hypothetical protein RMSM_04998 [Rhodopirellula maiorica SM1]|uniref:Uncharacterized protein n=1 Tax=Rhodopirellula maiorica SM1 TaxID=1265738 RepID=M5RF25_9BACT|nr:hypothetical protein RMSM_04998 [Rhodopirellula maiorica SM1]
MCALWSHQSRDNLGYELVKMHKRNRLLHGQCIRKMLGATFA